MMRGSHDFSSSTLPSRVWRMSCGHTSPAKGCYLFPLVVGHRNHSLIESTLLAMHDEHVLVRDILHVLVRDMLARLRDAADDFRVPDWAGDDHRALVTGLETLEHEIFRHVHPENYVLLTRHVC